MIQLGNCKQCSGALCVKTDYVRQGAIEKYDLDGQPLRAISRDANGCALQHSQVACLRCGAPEPGHPYQAELDAAEAAHAKRQARAADVVAPITYSTASHAEVMNSALERLARAVLTLTERVIALEEREAAAAAVAAALPAALPAAVPEAAPAPALVQKGKAPHAGK